MLDSSLSNRKLLDGLEGDSILKSKLDSMHDLKSYRIDARYPSLRQVADRLLALSNLPDLPPSLASELALASERCADGHELLEGLRESLEFYRGQLEDDLDRLRRELEPAPEPVDYLSHLRPDDSGAYAWDRWENQARAAGLAQDLAGLGRAVMREAVQHDWTPELKAECGWTDYGQAMLKLALRDGAAAEERWKYLLETDGQRGRWLPNGDWQSFGERE